MPLGRHPVILNYEFCVVIILDNSVTTVNILIVNL